MGLQGMPEKFLDCKRNPAIPLVHVLYVDIGQMNEKDGPNKMVVFAESDHRGEHCWVKGSPLCNPPDN